MGKNNRRGPETRDEARATALGRIRAGIRYSAAVVALVAGGCSPVLEHASQPAEVASQQAEFVTQPYRLHAGDTIDIRHRSAIELNETAVVQPDGTISLPLIHPVRAAGLSPDELGQALTKAYAADVRDPYVSVLIRSFGAQKVFIAGEVVYPGTVTLVQNETVMQAVANAGGLKDTARMHEIIVIRQDDRNHRRLIFSVDLDEAMHGNLEQDALLQPLDTILVPKSDIANVDSFVDRYIKQAVPVNLGASLNYTNYYTPIPGH